MDKNFIKKLMTQAKCRVCGQQYKVSNIEFLGYRDDLWFFHVLCRLCYTQGLIAIAVKEGNIPQVLTDLTEPEYAKFRDSKGIEAEDVLDIHDFLGDFDGDFARLLSEE